VANGFTESFDVVAKDMVNHIASDFAPRFGVSTEATRIRLENLGLLKRAQGRQLLDPEAAGQAFLWEKGLA
jgi:Zn-dependent peptidase ImmA (M78 family)